MPWAAPGTLGYCPNRRSLAVAGSNVPHSDGGGRRRSARVRHHSGGRHTHGWHAQAESRHLVPLDPADAGAGADPRDGLRRLEKAHATRSRGGTARTRTTILDRWSLTSQETRLEILERFFRTR